MINLSDFQPPSIAKIKKFSSTTGFLLTIFSDKVHAIDWRGPGTNHDGDGATSVESQVY